MKTVIVAQDRHRRSMVAWLPRLAAVTLTTSMCISACSDSDSTSSGSGSAAGAPTTGAGAGAGSGAGTGGAGGGGAAGDGGAIDGGLSACEELVAKCEPIDVLGDSDVHACVLTGMAGDESICQAGFADCRKFCGKALCGRIGGICHDKEETCHEMGHAGVAAPCFDRALECFKACM